MLSETKYPAKYVAQSQREILHFSPFGLTAKADASGVDLKVHCVAFGPFGRRTSFQDDRGLE